MTNREWHVPVVIVMAKELGQDVIFNNMRTLGLDRKAFDQLLNLVRRKRKSSK